jgi:peptide/nickel transport system permease protein
MVEKLSTIEGFVRDLTSNYYVRNFSGGFRSLFSDSLTKVATLFLLFVFLLGLVGPAVAPHDPGVTLRADDGQVLRNAAPSLDHPLGTNHIGQDVFSRVLVGARPTVMTALIAGTLMFTIGLVVGMTSGYVGGKVDNVLMRFTDFMYSVPILPASIVLVALLGGDFFISVFIIGALLWRGMARVIRSQVLQIKERPFILAARSTGAGTPRILLKHIFPNVAPMAILFTAIGAGYAIIIQASLAFLGIADPFVPTWGLILRNAYRSGMMADSWWWSMTPGLLISFTVLSAFLIGRGYETMGETEEVA